MNHLAPILGFVAATVLIVVIALVVNHLLTLRDRRAAARERVARFDAYVAPMMAKWGVPWPPEDAA